MAKYVYGIDLGTTYSCISYVDESGRANVIKNLEGTNTTPSVVNFASPNQVVVGQVAKESAVIDPNNTVSLVKTLMGKNSFAINYNGEDKSPEEVSAYILRKLAEDAAKEIDAEVKDVVITCPAYFGTAERTATKNAGIIAGLNVLEIISEPVAAAIYYGCTKEHEEKTILVYDLGGGTFDVTIMNINSEKIEIICSDGDHDLGGKDWDAATMRYLADEFVSQKGYEGDFDEYAQQDLRLKAEKAKQQLSAKEKTPVMVETAGERARIDFSREKFEEITSALLKSTIDKTDAAITVAEERGFKLDEILLVGGSTRMPQVTKALEERYGITPKILEPDEAVAKGAAIHAVNVYINNQPTLSKWYDDDKGDVSSDTVLDPSNGVEQLSVDPAMMSIGGKKRSIVVATTKSFAVEVIVDKKTREQKCYNMIIKNDPMPDGDITVSTILGTIDENQENVEIVVYESDFMNEYFDVDKDYVIGTALLELPGNLPVDSPVEITFSLNNEGILEVTGKDMTSNKEVHATMRSKYIMAGDMVEKLKEKSKQMVVI
ncbi:Hsp70 family protein [Methanosarcina mazei]|jgi:molecular chaperone DnaK (HSP70)|uniref:2-alkenal reductase n=1 Tax=Methanosarcina mazei TaxID=2209 RepID=A0A0F8CMJ7_METMZ|nr:Hsp70 family protein [Methanosarcina mazei]KKF98459.1 2-alkenal reductase [Methanosarcina mazei]KKG05637.1 2-alkenal reductase [Methanosarcina mazei]KKG06109.1 2-alkenal reductase [Methanosarcina mazei]KKH36614.1 2-alkenal reductase [Methanosarcina mazei]KKH39407.1 2-alkenal reductase [Methanosarcina mazei]